MRNIEIKNAQGYNLSFRRPLCEIRWRPFFKGDLYCLSILEKKTMSQRVFKFTCWQRSSWTQSL